MTAALSEYDRQIDKCAAGMTGKSDVAVLPGTREWSLDSVRLQVGVQGKNALRLVHIISQTAPQAILSACFQPLL